MGYVGGKHRIRKELAAIIGHECRALGVREVWEPFCGGLHVTAALGRRGIKVRASDLSKPLIDLYRAVRLGWRPPATLTRAQWTTLKEAHAAGRSHPLIGFAGFCASFNSVFFASYAPERAAGEFRSMMLRVRASHFVELWRAPYFATTPPPGSVVYCDPPYANTDRSAYRSLPSDERAFDSPAFWDWCRARHAEGTTVVVSEYSAPDDVPRIWAADLSAHTANHTGAASRVTDSVYLLRAGAKLPR